MIIMAYTARAYREFSEMLAAHYELINDESRSRMDPLEQERALHTHSEITEKVAEIFQADNPRGFDKDRFFDDVYGETRQ